MKSKLYSVFAVVLSISIIVSTMFSSIFSVAAISDIGDYEGGEELVTKHTVGDWISNANEHWHYCTECEQDVDKAAHTASDWIVDTDATAETAGHKHKECTVCGYVMEEEDIPVILTHIPGDINNDGKVNNKDLTRLFQYLSKWNVEVNAQALDVNGDGKVNNKDLTRLFQYLSKWDVQIF